MNDDFYSRFEQLFRGERPEIKARLLTYAPFFEPLLTLYPQALALDLGCGRGEWLELLKEKGFQTLGVDLDDGMLADCRALELNVRTQDAIAALQEMPNESISIVSAFHLVEHIPFDSLRTLVSEAYRVLKPGGLLIMETPNPENILVGTSHFYLDPTHTRPIPPGLLSFIPKYSGFLNVKVLRLQESPSLLKNESPTLLNVFGGTSPDYAVIAQKSAAQNVLDLFKSAFDLNVGLTFETLSNRYDNALQERINALDTLSLDQQAINVQQKGLSDRYEQKLVQVFELHAHYEKKLAQVLDLYALHDQKLAQVLDLHALNDQKLAQLQAINDQQESLAERHEQKLAQVFDLHALHDQKLAQVFDLHANHDQKLAEIFEIMEAMGRVNEALSTQVHDVYKSTSWKMTRPLRFISSIVQKLKK